MCVGGGLTGSLVLGQNQECYGGCFSPSYALHGEMADVRLWDRSLSAVRPSFSHLRLLLWLHCL